MNPIPRILQAEPGIMESNRQTLAKVSDLLELLDSAIDFPGLSESDWYQYGTESQFIAVGADKYPLQRAITLFNQLQ
jgi:hypothetical protein